MLNVFNKCVTKAYVFLFRAKMSAKSVFMLTIVIRTFSDPGVKHIQRFHRDSLTTKLSKKNRLLFPSIGITIPFVQMLNWVSASNSNSANQSFHSNKKV